MQLPQILTTALLALTPVLALPQGSFFKRDVSSPSLLPREFDLHQLAKRQSCVETCGGVCYWQSDINSALQKGYQLYQEGETEGSDSYPHVYNNYEGFDFGVSGPYYEFPILSDYDVYNGGSPGADRVIFNTAGQYAGVITHTGASGNDFVACAGDEP